MKRPLTLSLLAFPGSLATAILLVGCATRNALHETNAPAIRAANEPPATTDAKPSTDPAALTYETIEQVTAMPVCRAAVHRLDEFSSLLTTADGRKSTLGSPKGEQEVWHFVAMLKEGQTYEFPAAFLTFENRKFYGTADEIKSMPACTATAQLIGPCFTVFTASDGTMFVIGDPGSKPVVYRFLHTVEKGQTRELPGAFVDYQKDFRQEKER